MLQIENIRKTYKTGTLVQHALKGVSLSLRDNEFVAILGPSGSGKTTLLNIIGGLDRYDEGDLVINGISTKKYSDRDWDSYRNHTVGFVFQSYNLIPHQTILKNVELALTISGISAKERTLRATEALEKVGLKEHIHKRPSQLSGGQMQRVAIARALVNDPDILLADEPTGALDSETSLQVMDLLKEVASDRLVVMVTHNPELAETYATRIVTLMDGEITSDSDPYSPKVGDSVHKNMGRASMSFLTALSLSFNNLRTKKGRTILVAFAGSIGIIGIALILALSHGANQYIHNAQEESLQSYPLTINDTNFSFTSMYTLPDSSDDQKDEKDKAQVTELPLISGLLSGVKTNDLRALRAYLESKDCDIYDYVQSLEYGYKLTPQIFKKYDSGYRQVNPDKSIEALGFTNDDSLMSGLVSTFSSTTTFNPLPAEPKIYEGGYEVKAGRWPEKWDECVVVLTSRGRIPDTTLYNLGLKDPAELDKLMKAYSEGTSEPVDEKPMTFNYEDLIGGEFKLLSSAEYYTYDKQYKVWTDRSDDTKFLDKKLDKAETLHVVGVVKPTDDNLSPILQQGICYPASLIEHLIELSKDVGVVKAQLKTPKINVLTGKPFGEKEKNDKVDFSTFFSVDQKAIDKLFDPNASGFQLPDLSNMDLSALDFSDIDLGSAMPQVDLSKSMPKLTQDDIQKLFQSVNFTVSAESMQTLFEELLQGFTDYTKNDPAASIDSLPEAFAAYITSQDAREILLSDLQSIVTEKSQYLITAEDITSLIESVMDGYPAFLIENDLAETEPYSHLAEYLQTAAVQAQLQAGIEAMREKLSHIAITQEDVTLVVTDLIEGYTPFAENNDLPTVQSLLNAFADYLSTDKAKSLITDAVSGAVDTSAMEKTVARYTDVISGQISGVVSKILGAVKTQISAALQGAMANLMSGISDDMFSAFSFDPKSLSDLLKFNMSAQELKDLMPSLLSTTESSFDSNLRKMNYSEINKPNSITIYPRDYESKNHIKAILDGYNERMAKEGKDDKVIEYTDLVDSLMSTVTTIIDVISYILIAFVAISLVVSSIMIGVITYISVLERKKEIGILRAIGASKHNISSVFNAETFIIGTLAGLFGVGITEILIVPINLIIHSLTGQYDINAILPPIAAVILVVLSIVLTLIGGIIPSRKAAKSDPVTALRSD